jgi:hypothetical protein
VLLLKPFVGMSSNQRAGARIHQADASSSRSALDCLLCKLKETVFASFDSAQRAREILTAPQRAPYPPHM